MNKRVHIYDSTLRDGAQAEGISFSVTDKLKIVQKLDNLGVSYIEAGNPSSNPKDLEFFKEVKKLNLKNSKICAFGSTRRPNMRVEEDKELNCLVKSDAEALAVFGKAWSFHVEEIINTTLDENLSMIRDTIQYLKALNKEVIFDAEHFFDGYKNDSEYALNVINTAKEAGADWIVLCDTNGGTLPMEFGKILNYVVKELNFNNLGIHCHNDLGTAVANSLIAVQCGVTQVQGTFTGIGERCGNANLSTIIANLNLKMKYEAIEDKNLEQLMSTYRYISELSNVTQNKLEPYVGSCAFAHKGGMHIDAVYKNPTSFEHISPDLVGNERRILMSEVSGRSTIMSFINAVNPNIRKNSEEAKNILKRLKDLEYEGYQFEGAEGSFELLVRKELGLFKPSFQLVEYKVIIGEPSAKDCTALATMKIMVNGVMEIAAAEGKGPVNALDNALRKALTVFYKSISNMYLTDYKVRVIDGDKATDAKVRVIITSTDGNLIWSTVGVSNDIIEASFKALADSVEYKLIQ